MLELTTVMSPLVLALILRQDVVKDIQIPAMSLEKVVQRVSESFHSPMTVSTLIKDRIVLLSATQVTEADLRDQIAKMMDATWEKKDSGWHLSQSIKQQGMEDERRASMRLRLLKQMVAVRMKSPETTEVYDEGFGMKSFSQQQKGQGRFFGMSPGEYGLPQQRLMSRILAKFDLTRMAAVRNGERAVFSLRPNAMQLPLGISIDADIAQFRKESSIWRKTLERLSKDHEGQVQSKKNGDDDIEDRFLDSSIPENIAHVLLSVYTTRDGSSEINLTIGSDRPGDGHLQVSATSSEGIFAALTDDDLKQNPSDPIKLSQESEDFNAFFGQQKELIPATRLALRTSQFADCVTRDPLSYGFCESLFDGARRKKRNVIALVGDQSIRMSSSESIEPFFIDRFAELFGEALARDGNWLRLNSQVFEGRPFPRVDLKRIISKVRTANQVTLDDRADIAALQPRGASTIGTFVEAFAPPTQDESGDDDAIRTLGLLLGPERAQAVGPNGISYGQLNAKLRRHLFECAFFNQVGGLILREGTKLDGLSIFSSEPTIMAPDGILNSSIFRITQTNNDMFRCLSAGDSNGLTATARNWGSLKFRYENWKEFGDEKPDFDLNSKLSKVTLNHYDFQLIINANCEWKTHIEKYSPSNQPPFTLATMQAEYRDEFEAGLKDGAESLRLVREERKKSGGGGQNRQ